MVAYVLALKPAVGLYGQHDPSAVLFRDGEIVFGIEEERLSRNKHAVGEFPERSIEACLDHEGIDLTDVDEIRLPYRPELRSRILGHYLRDALSVGGLAAKANAIESVVRSQIVSQFFSTRSVERRLAAIDEPVPPIRTMEHHACHAASAFHPSGFDDALVLTIDAKGEYDSTVVWDGTGGGLERVRTYEHPNSLGLFYAVVTEYLGYRMFNGEGKVMGLAPYGERDPEIEAALREVVETGVEYDVTPLTRRWGTDHGVSLLEELFDRPRKKRGGEFDQWERNLAHTAQALLEETVLSITETYCRRFDRSTVALAGGVALNCKMNQCIRDSEVVDGIFVQPAAHDAGLAIGAGYIDQRPADVPEMTTAYLGPSYDTDEIVDLFSVNKIAYELPEEVEPRIAERLADGALVGWFQGRMEIGPRALGNRSILADPRTVESRDRVNEFVKHREGWRPFAPSILEEAAPEYLVGGEPAPFMIQTFDVREEKRRDLEAVLHPADDTTRPQTVRADQNPRYHGLISEFEAITGVPALLNTSFNDNGEPIVTRPSEAIKDFFGMGLDVLVLGDIVVEKAAQRPVPAADDERVAGRSPER